MYTLNNLDKKRTHAHTNSRVASLLTPLCPFSASASPGSRSPPPSSRTSAPRSRRSRPSAGT
uniref:Uncharacterized protein n=1 Tax=Aegilops tauschii subsp. strangulata TaxID=200361 RepID=A0A453PQU6_AEGTS